MRDLIPDVDSDRAFSQHALERFRHQCAAIPAYGAFARHVGRGPDDVRDWRDIPPVPASAFRSHDLSAAPLDSEAVTFETSGTTISRPGRVRLSDTALYEASLSRSFERHLLPDGAPLHGVVFGPTRAEAPRSSLWFMVDHVVRKLCTGGTWIVERGEPIWERADQAVSGGQPVLLLGTTLLFQAYFDRCNREGRVFQLPERSRAMDTGGAKGTRINLRREDVEAGFARVLGIEQSRLVNEYGMAELGSQFYQDTLLAAYERRSPLPGFTVAPWVRTRVLDPETMRERSPGVPGLLVHYDLANLEVPMAIQTEDVGTLLATGRLLLEGRLPEAERRGCSLPFEQFLERERA
jgi:acyl-protein synthetase LuxE